MTQEEMKDEAAWEDRFARIEREADAILKAEGTFRVCGIVFTTEGSAKMARMVEAERRVANRDVMMDRYLSTPRIQGSRV